jgi:glycosyltransferase involved in cell wall biosynthesis
VVTVTEGCAGLMQAFFGRQPVVIPNVHDYRIDEPPPCDVRTFLALEPDDFLLVMVGNEKPGTATNEVLRAMAELPVHVHLALVGSGWAVHATTIRERRLESRVHLCGALPPTQIVPFITSADAAIVLYVPLTVDYLHALPNRLFLPIAAGLPVLYPGQLVEMRSIVEQHGLGLSLDPSKPESIVVAVSRLMADGELKRRLEAGSEHARHVLAWDREEPRLEAILTSALTRTRSGG